MKAWKYEKSLTSDGHWICEACSKKRNTLRSIQRHYKQVHATKKK